MIWKRANTMPISPTPEEIKQARTDAGLTQTEAAETIYCSLGAWKKWESGERQMHPAFWALFSMKIGAEERHNALK